jgi:glycyl-tRNA synthetase
VTIDHQTLEDRTVTIRDRDSLEQTRAPIAELATEFERRLRETWRSPKLGDRPLAD